MEIEVRENFEIKKLTSFKIGGIVSKAYFPKNQKEFIYLIETLRDYIILGNCSNLLFSSSGYKGNVIITTKMNDYSINGTRITASCGVKGQLLSQKACENSLSGFEFMIGFPGTIGGEVYMNASAHGQSISDCLIRCCLYDTKNKELIYKEKSEMEFGYRTSYLQNSACVFLSAEFELKKGLKDEISDLMKRNLDSRRNIQPSLATPNAGSVFRNPPNDSAGRLLEKAGVKSFISGDAAVWQNHANFIVNKGCATSEDVLNLILKMKNAVKEQFTIELQPEIVYIGNQNRKEEELCKMLYQKTQK